jgi:hypothetical protein
LVTQSVLFLPMASKHGGYLLHLVAPSGHVLGTNDVMSLHRHTGHGEQQRSTRNWPRIVNHQVWMHVGHVVTGA